MALDGTYAGLQASIADWLVRQDLTAAIPDFITLVDADLNSMTQRLRVQEVEVQLSTVAGSRYVPLPSGYIEPLGLWLNWTWGREGLEATTAEDIEVQTAADRPYFWCIDDTNIAFERPSDQAYPLVFRMISGFGLSAGLATSLYVLQTYPNVYLFGALLKASPYLREDERIGTWQAMYQQAWLAMVAKEGRSRSMATLRVDSGLRVRPRFSIFRDF